MKDIIREKLLALAEEDYRKFSSALMPGTKNVLGVRLPLLRKLAGEIAKGDWRSYINTYGAADPDEYFEETTLHGLVLGCVKLDIEELLGHAAAFIPKINNWSVCDSFCTSLKAAKRHKERFWEFLQPYLASDKEYELRFGVVMLLNYYVEEEYIGSVLQLLDRIKHEGYYVKMAVAWALSICYIKLPRQTMAYLNNNTLDDFTYNKALQKITESFRVDDAAKAVIRGMKRKQR